MTIKYIARLDGQIVGTRTSTRVWAPYYAYAVVLNGHEHTNHVVCWNSRLDLARKEASRYQGFGYRADIVEAEVVAPRMSRTGYHADSVQAAIDSSRAPISGKEAKAIHSLLKGRAS